MTLWEVGPERNLRPGVMGVAGASASGKRIKSANQLRKKNAGG